MDQLQGYVEHIIYRNADNGYTVFNLIEDEHEIACVGIFPVLSEGEILLLHGSYVEHSTYGRQFKVESHEVRPPEDVLAIERYLAYGAVKGIGPTLAKRIVAKFKGETFRIMEEEPERLAEVKGISKRMAQEIAVEISEKQDIREAMVFLGRYGISTNLAGKIYKKYGDEMYSIIAQNPYRLADEVAGVGFKIADEIASKVGIAVDSQFRIESGLVYSLGQGAIYGHTYLPKEQLLNFASNLLGIAAEDIEPHIMNLAIERKVICKGDNIYSAVYYRMEEQVASMLHQLSFEQEVDTEALDAAINRIQAAESMTLDEYQRKALYQAATNGLFILTGGPGTGKTTTIRSIIDLFVHEGFDVLLAAPTGRAAKRMSETTGYKASTIHRMLEVSGLVGGETGEEAITSSGVFGRNQFNPLECDLVIVDEMSMVDISLMHALLKAMPEGGRLILVGDENQLPSVGPGNVLGDILASGAFASVTLQRIFRQSEQSDIVVNAHRINAGECFEVDNKSEDFFLMRRQEADKIIAVTLKLLREKLPAYVGAPSHDIQVLTPTRKGLLGVQNLNNVLQASINPPSDGKSEKAYGERTFREGDKVMHIRNNYKLEWKVVGKYGTVTDQGQGVFNGDVGVITRVNHYTKTLEVCYDDSRLVEYPFDGLNELELAYAITIHKSQGSEYPAVIIPLLQGPRMLMNRNLLYTAVTRAKKCLTIVGDERVFYDMIANGTKAKRYSGLVDRIREKAEELY